MTEEIEKKYIYQCGICGKRSIEKMEQVVDYSGETTSIAIRFMFICKDCQ